MNLASLLPGLFTFNRPVNERDPSFERGVFGLPPVPELMATLNRLEPFLITAPAAHGKTSLLYLLHNLFAGPQWPYVDCRWISPPAESFLSREALMGMLAIVLGSKARAIDFAELFHASDLLHQHASQGIMTILFIDASRCDNSDVLAWLVHSTFMMTDSFKDVVRATRTLIMLSGNFEPTMFTSGPTTDYTFNRLVLRNLNENEIATLCERVSQAARHYGGLHFDHLAVEQLFHETRGDKYFTNWLAAQSVARAAHASRNMPVVVTSGDISNTAAAVRAGSVVDYKIMPCLSRLLEESAEGRTGILELIEGGAARWSALTRCTRQMLFQNGAVGLAGDGAEQHAGAFELADRVRGGRSEIRYGIRNPMISEWVRGLTAALEEGRFRGSAGVGRTSFLSPPTSADLIDELRRLAPGREQAAAYERLVLQILVLLFSPPLQDPHQQVATVDRREVIDITFYNDSDQGFWCDMKNRHAGLVIVFEVKNMVDLANEEYQQISDRLDENRGYFGILVARNKDSLDLERAYRRLRGQRKVIITLTDTDIIQMLQDRDNDIDATIYLRRLYRDFIERA